MTYARFEDLPVWQAGQELALRIYRLTDDRSFVIKGDLADQLRRASLSVSNNIAEGFERGSAAELLQFLYYARGSAGEVRSMLRLCVRDARFEHLRSPIADLIPLAESCSRQIHAWADSLQNSDIKGHRHLNEQTRSAFEQHRRAEAFRQRLAEFRQGEA